MVVLMSRMMTYHSKKEENDNAIQKTKTSEKGLLVLQEQDYIH
jgi:hypothetical protein